MNSALAYLFVIMTDPTGEGHAVMIGRHRSMAECEFVRGGMIDDKGLQEAARKENLTVEMFCTADVELLKDIER